MAATITFESDDTSMALLCILISNKEIMFRLCLLISLSSCLPSCLSVHNLNYVKSLEWICTNFAVNDHHENISLGFDFDSIL